VIRPQAVSRKPRVSEAFLPISGTRLSFDGIIEAVFLIADSALPGSRLTAHGPGGCAL